MRENELSEKEESEIISSVGVPGRLLPGRRCARDRCDTNSRRVDRDSELVAEFVDSETKRKLGDAVFARGCSRISSPASFAALSSRFRNRFDGLLFRAPGNRSLLDSRSFPRSNASRRLRK